MYHPAPMRWSLVIPARDEARRIEATLRAYARALAPEVEILVVANDCSDDTAAIAQAVAAELGGIEVIEVAGRVGKGGAVRAGFRAAKGDLVGFADADLATPPEEVRRVLEAAALRGAAIGSRWLAGSRVTGRTAERNVAGRLFAALVQGLIGLPFRDTQCGIKIFRRGFLGPYLDTARMSDLAFDVELLASLLDQGADVEEVPIAWTAQPGSAALDSIPGPATHGARMAGSVVGLWWRRRLAPRRRHQQPREP
jgi:glycosyltransferase involved in cell wall biosynthesis